jgi:hypothetical protein
MARLLGAPSRLSSAEADEALAFIRSTWQLQFGGPLGPLLQDLEQLREFFDPVARGGRLRARLQVVVAGSLTCPSFLDEVAVMALDEERNLITPEGRGLYELLTEQSADQEGVVHLDAAGVAIERTVAGVVRQWSRHRLLDVIAKQTGHGPPMHAAAAAMVLLLLVNGSTSPATAVRRLSKEEQPRFDRSIARIIDAFASVARPSETRSPEEFRMYGGWHLSEARRRLPGQLVVDGQGRVYVPVDQVPQVIDFVVRDLKRSSIDQQQLLTAFDALVAAYRRELPVLTDLGSGFESASTVDSIRARLRGSS